MMPLWLWKRTAPGASGSDSLLRWGFGCIGDLWITDSRTVRPTILAFAIVVISLVALADGPELEPQMSLEDRVAQAKLIVIGKQGFPGPTGRRVNTSVRVEQILFGSIPTNMTLYVAYYGTLRLLPDVASRKPMTFPKGGSRWIFFLTDEGLKQPPGTNYYTRAIGQYKYAHDGLELASDETVKQVKELIAIKKK